MKLWKVSKVYSASLMMWSQPGVDNSGRRCAEWNIVLNEDKQQAGLTEIKFHGHRITKDGVKVDEA